MSPTGPSPRSYTLFISRNTPVDPEPAHVGQLPLPPEIAESKALVKVALRTWFELWCEIHHQACAAEITTTLNSERNVVFLLSDLVTGDTYFAIVASATQH